MPSAMGNDGTPFEMSEAHLLAPWYATGQLDEAEIRELDELAGQDPAFARILDEAKKEAEATVLLNEALGIPSQGLWERIGGSIELETKNKPISRFAGVIASFKDTIQGFPEQFAKPQWQAVAAIALAVCVIQAGAILYLSLQGPAKYGVASGSQSAATRPAFVVSFPDAATIGEVSKALDDAGAFIVDGPNAERLYHLGLRDDTVKAKDQAYQILRSSEAVKLILPEK
jgi:hypothetical protein